MTTTPRNHGGGRVGGAQAARAMIGSAVFLLLAPGTVAGLVPWLLTGWRLPAGGGWLPAMLAGSALMLGGGAILLESFARFALQGEGTPAPPMPTRKLVITGVYRRVRNPMYVAVVALILGQALLFQSGGLLAYGAVVWLAFHIFVVFFEERRLAREFSGDYATYRRNVPRWLPRLRPWRP